MTPRYDYEQPADGNDAGQPSTHWLTRYDQNDGEPYGNICHCPVGEDHDGAGALTGPSDPNWSRHAEGAYSTVEDLIERSSFGTPGAKALRDSVPVEQAQAVVEASKRLAARDSEAPS